MVNKLITPPTQQAQIDKINEIIDNLGGGGSGTVDQTYDATSTNAQSGVAIAGAGFLQNTATGDHSLTIDGYSTSQTYAINIGHVSNASGSGAVVLGFDATAAAFGATAIGTGATVTASANNAIQLGTGANATANTFSVGFNYGLNYQLLDGSTGLIPYQRIDSITDNNAGGQLKTWTGTRVQYDAIQNKDANTLYNITDDTDVTLSLLELLYPVGAIYIGTCANCPLQTIGIGTWQLVAVDRVLQGAGTRGSVGSTVNERLPNIKGSTGWISAANASAQGNGAIYWNTTTNQKTTRENDSNIPNGLVFDASRWSSTYQDNAPVQQDAYLVNIWERTA